MSGNCTSWVRSPRQEIACTRNCHRCGKVTMRTPEAPKAPRCLRWTREPAARQSLQGRPSSLWWDGVGLGRVRPHSRPTTPPAITIYLGPGHTQGQSHHGWIRMKVTPLWTTYIQNGVPGGATVCVAPLPDAPPALPFTSICLRMYTICVYT